MERVITPSELAILLKKSKTTIWRYWAKGNELPKPILINGRCIGWKQSVIEDWLSKQ